MQGDEKNAAGKHTGNIPGQGEDSGHEAKNKQQNAVIPFKIDREECKITESQNPVSGAFLFQIGKVQEGYDLLMRARGQGDDVEILREETYTIIPGDHFYTAKSELTPGA